jgi:PAS domain S-box-containing protein
MADEETSKTRRDLRAEVQELRQRLAARELVPRLSNEQRLKLALFDLSPFTAWACTRDFKIVFWNRRAEEVYGHSAAEALGKDFVELFVDAPEQQPARDDCLKIIDGGLTYTNFLAYDQKRDGRRLTMLTNSFRVYDDERHAYLQAEVGLEISDLSESESKHRTLRELGMQLLALQIRTLDTQRKAFNERLEAAYHHARRKIDLKQQEVSSWIAKIEKSTGRAEAENIAKGDLAGITSQFGALESKHSELRQRIAGAKTIEGLDGMESDLEEFETKAEGFGLWDR